MSTSRPPLVVGSPRERRLRGLLGEWGALLAAGAVEAGRTEALLAGTLEAAAPMDETPTTLRLPRDLLDRAERLAEDGLGTGARVSRSLVLRRAVELGLDALDSAAGDLSPTAAAEVRAELADLRRRVEDLEAAPGGAS
jgi:hypothetical protein